MFTALTSTLAAAGVIATGAVIGVSASASASAPGSEEPTQGPGASMSETHRQDGGHHDHPDMDQMAQMHEQMMADHPDMAKMHEQMMAEHPEMAKMHEQMMGGMGTGMMGGDSDMGMQ